jgi:hypothetical protein
MMAASMFTKDAVLPSLIFRRRGGVLELLADSSQERAPHFEPDEA